MYYSPFAVYCDIVFYAIKLVNADGLQFCQLAWQ